MECWGAGAGAKDVGETSATQKQIREGRGSGEMGASDSGLLLSLVTGLPYTRSSQALIPSEVISTQMPTSDKWRCDQFRVKTKFPGKLP